MQTKTLTPPAAGAAQAPGRGRTQAASPVVGRDWTVPGLRLKLAYVAPGSFQMGSSEGEADELPIHEVRISHGYWIGTVAVTQAEYRAVMAHGTAADTGGAADPSAFKDERHPVETVSWDAAVAFCERLNERERAAGRLPEGLLYRLPTEAEWEFAARGGNQSRGFTYSGSNSAAEVAWHDANSDRHTHPVGQKQPNELGLYDMSGNVWEWCLGWYDAGYYGRSPQEDPENTEATCYRVRRGGSWIDDAAGVRSAYRFGYGPGQANATVGFRACLASPAAGRSATAEEA